ncbi:MAG: hypothetical protein SV375_23535, partial [Thermodesulfobacteriota bacterium]|nr:hypothetical protein [Thermodesulfobacteriota bacterium]
GQSVTVDSAELAWTPGQRFNKGGLMVKIRASRGGQFKIEIPEDARLQIVKINGKSQPIPKQAREILIPLQPGSQTANVEWHQDKISHFLTSGPVVSLGRQAVNARVTFRMPTNRWILWTDGPRLGPAVLFWTYLIVVILAACALGRISWTPLKIRHWLLLGLGLTQVHPLVAIMVLGWLLALGLRRRHAFPDGWFWFNTTQIVLALWTIAALIGLYTSIRNGLLGLPDMQIAGNGSSDFHLYWTQDRIQDTMPQPWVLSLPLFIYRILMLTWALWLAYTLLRWLRWGWQCFSEDGLWRKILKRKVKTKKDSPELAME